MPVVYFLVSSFSIFSIYHHIDEVPADNCLGSFGTPLSPSTPDPKKKKKGRVLSIIVYHTCCFWSAYWWYGLPMVCSKVLWLMSLIVPVRVEDSQCMSLRSASF
jgi:hypothetical protein